MYVQSRRYQKQRRLKPLQSCICLHRFEALELEILRLRKASVIKLEYRLFFVLKTKITKSVKKFLFTFLIFSSLLFLPFLDMLQPGCWPGGKAVAVVLEGLGFESWPEIVFFFQYQRNLKIPRKTNCWFFLCSLRFCRLKYSVSASVVHSYFKGGHKIFLKNS